MLSVVALLHVVEGGRGRDVASPHQRRKHIFVERPRVDVDSISDPVFLYPLDKVSGKMSASKLKASCR